MQISWIFQTTNKPNRFFCFVFWTLCIKLEVSYNITIDKKNVKKKIWNALYPEYFCTKCHKKNIITIDIIFYLTRCLN